MGGYGSGRVGERELITNLRFLNPSLAESGK